MKVAVVTPYYETPSDWLHQCHRSVRAQTHPCTHILIADGEPIETVDKFDALHLTSIGPNNDYGNTARAIGSIAAIRQGFDAICYLDADNWYQLDHVKRMVTLHRESRAAICTSARMLHHIDGTKLGLCLENDGDAFVDTNCMFLTKEAFPIISVWHTVDRRLDCMADRVVWFQAKQLGFTTAHSSEPTVCYRTNFQEHYEQFNVSPPEGTRNGYDYYPSRKLFEDLKTTALKEQDGDPAAVGIDRPIVSDDGMSPSFRQHRHMLISLIGLPRVQVDKLLEGLVEDCQADGKVPVFIVDEVDLAVDLGQRQLVEHLPCRRNRDAFAPDLDWDLYLDRRLRQIKEKWRCARIVALGLPLKAFVADLDKHDALVADAAESAA